MRTFLQSERISCRQCAQGVELAGEVARFRTWAPQSSVEAVMVDERGKVQRTIALQDEGNGYWSGEDRQVRAGDLYKYRLNGAEMWPDPMSRFQPLGVHGPSAVVDPTLFQWNDDDWSPPTLRELIIYELHIGAFTPEGTFRAAMGKLEHVAGLGANAIEIMPIGDFPGARNWGYDGVMLYAPARIYGRPDDLRELVDAAHGCGLAVILDVVYNHLGPDGNYVGCYTADYFNPAHETPWGAAFNLELEPVRDVFAQNPGYWMREFHIDGFRLDATHEIYDPSPRHLLAEIAENVHALGGLVVAEDERNDPALISSAGAGGLGLDGCWADDFHHVVRVALTGERDGYFANYSGSANELCETLERGWLYCGQPQSTSGKRRGGDPSSLPPDKFIYCISNHDQVGNRAFGERLNHIVSPAAFRTVSALLCLAPYTPMLFMGQEWSASARFQYFTDHEAELGRKVTRGRREEFRHFAPFRTPGLLEKIPDPQAEQTFLDSKLEWNELRRPEQAETLRLYQELLRLRKSLPALQLRARGQWQVRTLEHGIVAIIYGIGEPTRAAVIVDLVGGRRRPQLEGAWNLILSTNEERFGGNGSVEFDQPSLLLLESN